MKKILFTIPFFLFGSVLFAQDADLYWSMLGVINDKDGYTNVRKEASVSSSVLGKIYNHQVFYVFGHDEQLRSNMLEVWYGIDYKEAKEGYRSSEETASGYIHTSRILPLAKLNRLSKRSLFHNTLVLSNDTISVAFTQEQLDATKYPIKKNVGGWIESIDNQKPWGTDGNLPESSLASVVISNKGKTYSLPKSAISNLYQPCFYEDSCGVFIGKENELYIVMVNGDGAGTYMVIWAIAKDELESMNLINPF
jgi:hypothetical protein